MLPELLPLLKCPVTRTNLKLTVISKSKKMFANGEKEIILDGVLSADEDWFYPIIGGIPRLVVEAIYDYPDFLKSHVPDFQEKVIALEKKFGSFLKMVKKKNAHTKASFAQEWNVFDYEKDKVWDADAEGMLQRFLKETDETKSSLNGKLIFDAGCGNGLLNQFIAAEGAVILGMDFSLSIERAFQKNNQASAYFIQGDVQFPPVAFETFDIVHSSGVLIATNNTELSLSCLEPCIKSGGKISTWFYHPRKDFIHNLFNFIRNYSSKLPVKLQYYLYWLLFLPPVYLIKKVKGNPQNKREMMIDILDWFSPEYRWEHTHDEAEIWLLKRNFHSIKVTTNEMFGFNIVGVKN